MNRRMREDPVELFIRLITDYSKSHGKQRPTVEDLKEITNDEGYSFSVKEIKDFGSQALERIIK